MSKSKNLAKNTLILGAGKVASQISGFLLLPLYTSHLSPGEYGLLDLSVIYISLLVPAITLQLEMATFRYLVDARGDSKRVSLIISNILTMSVMFALPWILLLTALGSIFNIEHLGYILATSIAMLASNLTLQTARGLGSNRDYAISSIVIGLATLAGALLFISGMKMGIDGALLSMTLAHALASLYVIRKLHLAKYVKPGLKDTTLRKEILGYSTPLVPNGVAWWTINASSRVIISTFISTAANGIYAISTKFPLVLSSILGVFSMSWTESASVNIDSPDRDQFFSRVANSTVRIFGALGLGLIAVVPFIFPLMVDDSFSEAYNYIPILIIGVLFNSIVGVYSAIYIAKKLTKQVMNTSLVSAAVSILLTIALMPMLGLYAAVIATATSFLAMAIFRHYDVQKHVKITYEKSLFIILPILYAVVIALYYRGDTAASSLALTIAIVFSYLINKQDLSKITKYLKSHIGQL